MIGAKTTIVQHIGKGSYSHTPWPSTLKQSTAWSCHAGVGKLCITSSTSACYALHTHCYCGQQIFRSTATGHANPWAAAAPMETWQLNPVGVQLHSHTLLTDMSMGSSDRGLFNSFCRSASRANALRLPRSAGAAKCTQKHNTIVSTCCEWCCLLPHGNTAARSTLGQQVQPTQVVATSSVSGLQDGIHASFPMASLQCSHPQQVVKASNTQQP